MNLEAYLISKKIDSTAFQKAEPEVWKMWNEEFEHMHPNSFTMQKLNLINPIRRKYPLPVSAEKPSVSPATPTPASAPTSDTHPKPSPPPSSNPKPSIPKPVFKPKPKMQ